MSRKQFKLFVLLAIIAVSILVALVTVMNSSMKHHLAAVPQAGVLPDAPVLTPPAAQPDNEKNAQGPKLTASDLTPYQIRPQRRSNLFKDQQYWDVTTQKALEQSESLRSDLAQGIRKGASLTPSDYKEQLKRLEQRIKEYKQEVDRNPGDMVAQQKLQNLYMLKATVKALKDTVITKE